MTLQFPSLGRAKKKKGKKKGKRKEKERNKDLPLVPPISRDNYC